ncbi:MAG TPA: aminomethyl-transferring glycine dehydrogenase subunit GcvPB [bacterium]|nr:aminomethyl-transferring glycine dehydrogenase subunit GcvPB [bacterium]
MTVRRFMEGLVQEEGLIFERSREGKRAFSLPEPDVPVRGLAEIVPGNLLRDELKGFPEVSEVDVVRHFTRLSTWNYGVDTGYYPLGSCTMKYNPKVNEDISRLPGFAQSHPYQGDELSQGALRLMLELAEFLAEIGGMAKVSLAPAAGAHGELTGTAIIRAFHTRSGNPRSKIIVPDSAHGTNPASTSRCGYESIEIRSNEHGCADPHAVAAVMTNDVAGIMITNPNTLGIFEENICEIAEIVHSKGGLVYCDGANLNAVMGIARFGEMGVDVMHFNLHKTFSTPHGGGGPGGGPVGVVEKLAPFLPLPTIEKGPHGFYLNYDSADSIGRIISFYGNFGVMVKAYCWIRSLGPDGIKAATENAVINANYIRQRLKKHYHLPYDRLCKHECVFSDASQLPDGVNTMDIAKRLMDYGMHPPTNYFPLIVNHAIMVEPTESEDKASIDQYIDAMIAIAKEAQTDPEVVKSAPHKTKLSRLDEVRAARRPVLRWRPKD